MSTLMTYKGYHAGIEYDGDDNIFVGSVLGINDSLNFHGSSTAELEMSFHESVDNYLSLCEKIGKKPDKEYKGSFNVRISPETHRAASIEAQREKISLNQLITKAVESYLSSRL